MLSPHSWRCHATTSHRVPRGSVLCQDFPFQRQDIAGDVVSHPLPTVETPLYAGN